MGHHEGRKNYAHPTSLCQRLQCFPVVPTEGSLVQFAYAANKIVMFIVYIFANAPLSWECAPKNPSFIVLECVSREHLGACHLYLQGSNVMLQSVSSSSPGVSRQRGHRLKRWNVTETSFNVTSDVTPTLLLCKVCELEDSHYCLYSDSIEHRNALSGSEVLT